MSEDIKPDIETEFMIVSEETSAQIEQVPELPKLSDFSLAISLFLQDKQELLDSGDNWNPALVEAGDQSGWRFKNIPCPSLEELQALLQAQEPSQE